MRFSTLTDPKPYWSVTTVQCDVCKTEIRETDDTEVEIGAKIGHHWGDCDDRIAQEIDVCKRCWVDKVKPAVESTCGVKFRERRADDFESEAWATRKE